jgi:hypothetical protein
METWGSDGQPGETAWLLSVTPAGLTCTQRDPLRVCAHRSRRLVSTGVHFRGGRRRLCLTSSYVLTSSCTFTGAHQQLQLLLALRDACCMMRRASSPSAFRRAGPHPAFRVIVRKIRYVRN